MSGANCVQTSLLTKNGVNGKPRIELTPRGTHVILQLTALLFLAIFKTQILRQPDF